MTVVLKLRASGAHAAEYTTGNYATNPPAGQGLITQNLSAFCPNARRASVTYETSREAFNHVDNKTGYDVEFLKQENPKVSYIIAYLGG